MSTVVDRSQTSVNSTDESVTNTDWSAPSKPRSFLDVSDNTPHFHFLTDVCVLYLDQLIGCQGKEIDGFWNSIWKFYGNALLCERLFAFRFIATFIPLTYSSLLIILYLFLIHTFYLLNSFYALLYKHAWRICPFLVRSCYHGMVLGTSTLYSRLFVHIIN